MKFINLLGVFLGFIVQNALSQNTYRESEDSLHNSPRVATATTPRDSTNNSFLDKFAIEFVGGPTMCFFTGADVPDQVMFHRYVFGLAVVHRTTRTLNLEAKILWEPKGVLFKYHGSEYNHLEDLLYEQGVKLDYLTLALTVDYYIDCKRTLYVGAGVSAGMLTRQSTFTYTYDDNGKNVSSYKAETFAYKKFEAGLVSNVGYRRHVWKQLLVNVQVLGNFGITDLTKKFDPDPYPDKNSNANLALLIGIGIGR